MKPRLFIGSSVEALGIAYAIQENLEHDTDPVIWNQGIFEPSGSSLGSLIKAAKDFHAAVFVFTPDDIAKIKRVEHSVPRDNVVFELGLFIGSLGLDRVFFVVPRGAQQLHLPTDLLGITPVTFEPNRSDGNMVAALGPACNQIRSKLGTFSTQSKQAAPTNLRAISDEDALALIHAWLDRTLPDMLGRPRLHSEIDEQLLLPPGTSARLTKRAIESSSLKIRVAADTGQMIQIAK